MDFTKNQRKGNEVKLITGLLILFAALLFQPVMAQKSKMINISGRVLDDKGLSIPGVSVTDNSTTRRVGTTTDEKGNFSINVDEKSIISFTFIGYDTKKLEASKIKNTTVVLQEMDRELNSVVIIGYGTSKKKDLTGSVSSLKSEELTINNPTNIASGLQGKMAGVQITQTDGAPGADVSILVRGSNSFSTSSEPLYVVDGIPYDGSLSGINPNDIESVDILKDASATAIYGSRGANGVVMITTKHNKGNDKIEVSSLTTVADLVPTFKVLNAYQYAQKQDEMYQNQTTYYGGALTVPFPATGVWSYKDNVNHTGATYTPSPSDFLTPRLMTDAYGNSSMINNTNWLDAITRQGLTQQYNLSINGGDEKGSHVISLGYLNQQGTLVGTGYDRYTARLGLTHKVKNWLEVGVNANFSNDYTDLAKDQVTGGAGGGLVRSALYYPPIYSPADKDKIETLSYLAYNPASYLQNQINNLNKLWISTSSYFQIKFSKDLIFRQNIGYRYSDTRSDNYYSTDTYAGSNVHGLATRSDTYGSGTTFESLLTYNKTFNAIHKITALAGVTFEHTLSTFTNMSGQNFSDDLTGYYNMSKASQINSLGSGQTETSLLSYLGRVNYTLMDKYLFTASVRRDGSSKFTEQNKFATFLSGAVAWRVSEEKFIKDLNIFHDFKLRASYGETGNQGINPYQTMQKLNIANQWINGTQVNGYAVSGPTDPNLKWETTVQTDLGVDMSFLKGRLGFVVDYYHKNTRDLLQNLTIPYSTGYTSIQTNFGNVTNDGLEISANLRVISTKDWTWNINPNISFNKNVVNGLNGDQYADRIWYNLTGAMIERNGDPIGTVYGYVTDGFYNNLAEVRADPQYANVTDAVAKQMIGEQKYRDINHDGKITEADKTVIGDVNPKYVYGITNTLTWKAFSLSIFVQGTQGNDIINGNKTDMLLDNAGNLPDFMYNERWTPETAATAQYPKLRNQNRSLVFSNAYVEDGSYLRLKNVSLSYNINKLFHMKSIQNIKLSITGSNLYTLTKYSWFDPDVSVFGSDVSRRGVDMYSYPTSRTFSFGVNITI